MPDPCISKASMRQAKCLPTVGSQYIFVERTDDIDWGFDFLIAHWATWPRALLLLCPTSHLGVVGGSD